MIAVWAALLACLQLVPPAGLVPVAWAVWVLIVAGTKVFYPVSGALSEALPPRESRATYMATASTPSPRPRSLRPRSWRCSP